MESYRTFGDKRLQSRECVRLRNLPLQPMTRKNAESVRVARKPSPPTHRAHHRSLTCANNKNLNYWPVRGIQHIAELFLAWMAPKTGSLHRISRRSSMVLKRELMADIVSSDREDMFTMATLHRKKSCAIHRSLASIWIEHGFEECSSIGSSSGPPVLFTEFGTLVACAGHSL